MYNMQYYDQIIRDRQAELFNEINDIEGDIRDLEQRIDELRILHEKRLAEYDMLNNVVERGLIANTRSGNTTTSRMSFDDAVKSIFNKAGRPIKFSELRDELARYGWKWSSYNSAYYRLSKLDIIEPAGKMGYYQLVRY